MDEIFRYTRERWGQQQAERYLTGLFAAFDGLLDHSTPSRPIPAELGVHGYFFATNTTLSIGANCQVATSAS
ncbi:type II toxin-antitoxin system RelE/ParE family toxin [uncultured Comamonas sp.]|uniref:type II toxin-antitoxin system RelE/ParE family toxin n=1 Tax=uncultured Comamonas sp. TaxID=114710 RepID=UPI00345A2DB4